MSIWRSCLRLDSFYGCLPLNPSTMHSFLLAPVRWWHLFPHNRFTSCSHYSDYYVWFLVNKNLIAAKVASGRDRGKHSLFVSCPLLRGRKAMALVESGRTLFFFLSSIRRCRNDQKCMVLWFITKWKSPNVWGPHRFTAFTGTFPQVSCN